MQDIKTIIVKNELKAYVMEKRAEQRELEERYNHYHDPRNGRFASGAGGGTGLYYSMGKGKGAVVGATSDLSPVAQIAAKLTTPLKINDLGGLPELTGSSSEISKATKIRNEMGKYLQNYVATKGGFASAKITSNYIKGTSKERAQFVLQQAKERTFGNSSLLPDKIKSEIATQKEYADRYSRFTEAITRHKSASWWNLQSNTAIAEFAMKDYIDGKGWDEAILGKKRI